MPTINLQEVKEFLRFSLIIGTLLLSLVILRTLFNMEWDTIVGILTATAVVIQALILARQTNILKTQTEPIVEARATLNKEGTVLVEVHNFGFYPLKDPRIVIDVETDSLVFRKSYKLPLLPHQSKYRFEIEPSFFYPQDHTNIRLKPLMKRLRERGYQTATVRVYLESSNYRKLKLVERCIYLPTGGLCVRIIVVDKNPIRRFWSQKLKPLLEKEKKEIIQSFEEYLNLEHEYQIS